MCWPVTNCSPMSFMARCTPWRISGSPPLPMTRVSAEDRPFSLLVAVSLPVSTRPQAAAFTNSEGERPTCERQSPLLILSRISASRVALSGMRKSASARHISATPSWLESENSCTSAATPLVTGASRRPCTRREASSRTLAAWASSCARASGSNAGRHSVSGLCQAAVMAARSGVCGRIDWAKARKGCASCAVVGCTSSLPSSGAPSPAPKIRRVVAPRSSASTYCSTACLISQCGVRFRFWAALRIRSRRRSSTLMPTVVDMGVAEVRGGRGWPQRRPRLDRRELCHGCTFS